MSSDHTARTVARLCGGAVILGLLSMTPASGADDPATLQRAIDAQTSGNAQAAKSQQRVDRMADDTRRMFEQYKLALRQTASLRAYNDNLEAMIRSQGEEKISFEKQLSEINVTQREIVPLMQRMVEALEQFVALDVPFLLEERQTRVRNLHALLTRADVATSEKYRRLLEAYQVETEYGRTIEAYEGKLPGDDGERAVDFLRIGRIALMYQTLDGKESGVWDAGAGQWVDMSGDYRTAIAKGLRIARKQAAPDLLEIPVPAAEGAK